MDFYFLERRARGSREFKEILVFQETRQRDDVEHGLHRQPKHTLKEGHARAQQALEVKQTLQIKSKCASSLLPGGVAAWARRRRRLGQEASPQYAISHKSPYAGLWRPLHNALVSYMDNEKAHRTYEQARRATAHWTMQLKAHGTSHPSTTHLSVSKALLTTSQSLKTLSQHDE